MAMVQRYLTQQEWDDMAKENFAKGQGLRDLLAMLPWATHEMPQAELDSLLTQAGLPFRVLLRLSRGRFARLQERATRHLDGVS